MIRAASCLLLLAAFAPALAQAADPVASTPRNDANSKREVRAIRLTSPVRIDGILDEPVWRESEAVDWFLQRDPNEDTDPSQRTEFRIAYDDDAIYFGARMYDTAPDSILARLTRRDVSIPSDRVSLYLDPYYDRRSGYYFMVNAAGTKYDGSVYNDGWEDGSWDGVWEGMPHRDEKGWTCEMRIPYSQLRFQKAAQYKWGINVRRVFQRGNEENFLVFSPKQASGFVSRFPALVGIEDVHPGSALEISPYLTSKAEYLRADASDPFNDGSRHRPDGGADLRMPLGSRLTLNATVNPDFGQVEVDPAVVNLSDFETFYSEKRPFFVEGASMFSAGQEGADDYWGFNWPQPTFFYSRRIGRPAQGRAPDAEYADLPGAATILGAAKVTGKLSPSVNFGMLHALTGKEIGEFADTSGTRFESELEPLTYYGVTRGLKEFKDRRRGLGFMGTVAARAFDDSRLRDQLNSASLLGVVDGWSFLDKDKMWVASGWAGATHVSGTKARILALQRSSTRYMQRPDSKALEVDPDATSLTGTGARVWLNKQKGSSFANAAIGYIAPEFENNDLGFLRRANQINAHAGGGYKWTNANKWRKHANVLGAVFATYDFDGDPNWAGVWGGWSVEYANNYSWEVRTAYNPKSIDSRRSRGGPKMLNAPGLEVFHYIDTDGKAKRFYYLEAYSYTQPEMGSKNYNISPGVEWKPVSNVSLRVGPGYERVIDNENYVGTIADAAAVNTYGNRYVFARLQQTTWSADVRLNWAFSPNLSLQFYGQPLISRGEYTGYKELARPRSRDFVGPGAGPWTYDATTGNYDPDGIGAAFEPRNRDFHFKSLRGNAVMRWEYMPGSTFYAVWTQQRTDDDVSREFSLGPSFRRLVRAKSDNVFLAKVTYYLNI